MKIERLLLAAASAAILVSPLAAQDGAGGPQSGLTFGGTGIDNSYVLTNANAGTIGVLLGLTATQRCGTTDCGPAVTHSGTTFFATPGASNNTPGSPYASWNFDWAIVETPGAALPDYTYQLSYDFDPAVGNSSSGTFFFGAAPGQDSWNLGMDFLGFSIPGLISPPPGSFDPTANGEYYLKLTALDANQAVVGFADMDVDVGSVATTPEPATMSMLGLGLVGLAGMTKRRRK